MANSLDPGEVVQRQLDAYNAKDVDALVAVYADDAELYEHPTKLLAKGSAALRDRYRQRFADPKLKAVLLKRVVLGAMVIDHEEVICMFPEGSGTIELIMIYQIEDGRISKAWTIAGEKRFD
jgi:hypothetical protein